ncbi:hypothetical protein SZN_22671 [Streptomyces zinciresistens K42]|uniref:Uncharacterized protein n=2 Tax=Streptomyces TaxID=1883 RepID=G2GGA0_9ACTN|nr:hypothetical protein SZN_22671 [Streptomyces zinciresistens K42]
MAFGPEELRVLRRALALALHPGPAPAEDAEDCLHLAASLDEATREAARLSAFLVADLARYRAALPGTASGYLTLLEEALTAGHHPTADDLAALGALRGNPAAAALLTRCRPPAPAAVPPARSHLHALPGGRAGTGRPSAAVLPAQAAGQEPAKPPRKRPAEKPAAPRPTPEPTPAAPKPNRPIPTPGEVFPRRKPAPPRQLAAG